MSAKAFEARVVSLYYDKLLGDGIHSSLLYGPLQTAQTFFDGTVFFRWAGPATTKVVWFV